MKTNHNPQPPKAEWVRTFRDYPCAEQAAPWGCISARHVRGSCFLSLAICFLQGREAWKEVLSGFRSWAWRPAPTPSPQWPLGWAGRLPADLLPLDFWVPEKHYSWTFLPDPISATEPLDTWQATLTVTPAVICKDIQHQPQRKQRIADELSMPLSILKKAREAGPCEYNHWFLQLAMIPLLTSPPALPEIS